jgi:hypothetical protein
VSLLPLHLLLCAQEGRPLLLLLLLHIPAVARTLLAVPGMLTQLSS